VETFPTDVMDLYNEYAEMAEHPFSSLADFKTLSSLSGGAPR
jgi:hypothetical protein